MSTKEPGEVVGSGGQLQIVIVDPDPRVRSALSNTISAELDLLVVGVESDVQAALPVVGQACLCVVLIDVSECDADLSSLAALTAMPGCRVVAMSVASSVRPACLAAGAVEFVLKGCDPDQILAALRQARDSPPV